MGKIDFKLNYYFEKYKDYAFSGRSQFRKIFNMKESKFEYLEELIVMIERYQIKKYGTRLFDESPVKSSEERRKESKRASQRNYWRYKK